MPRMIHISGGSVPAAFYTPHLGPFWTRPAMRPSKCRGLDQAEVVDDPIPPWVKFQDKLVGGLVAIFYFPINIGNSHPNWLSYFSEGFKPPTCKSRGDPPNEKNTSEKKKKTDFASVVIPSMTWKIHPIWHSVWQIFWHSIWHSVWDSIWHSIWHIFWHSICHIFWHSIWHVFWHSIWHIFGHSSWQIFWHSICVSGRWGPVEVRRGPRRAESRRLRSGEAHSSESRRLRSGEVHSDRELAVEVWRGPLWSSVGRWGPARPTAIKICQVMTGEE